jgi:hypothetical protein
MQLLKSYKAFTITGMAKVTIQYSADTLGLNQNFALRIIICSANRYLRQDRTRLQSYYNDSQESTITKKKIKQENGNATISNNRTCNWWSYRLLLI